jgi:hypothetical protein
MVKLLPLRLLGGIVVPLQEENNVSGTYLSPLRQSYGKGVSGIFMTALFLRIYAL